MKNTVQVVGPHVPASGGVPQVRHLPVLLSEETRFGAVKRGLQPGFISSLAGLPTSVVVGIFLKIRYL